MDQGRRETNRKLSEIEKRIQKEYAQAQRELTQKMNSHFNAFQAQDEEWRRKLHDGEVTEEQYRKWRTSQMAIGKRWQEMRDTVAEDLVNTTQIAKSIANGYMPEVYSLNANYATYEIEKETQMDTSFTLYNAQAVERLIRDDPEILQPPGKQMKDKIEKGEVEKWEKGQIQSVTIQAILQGESVKNMAKRISKELCVKDENAALRYARTAVNGAENAGRLDSFRRAKAMGIDLKKMWVASPDGRTRDWHVDLDGQTVDIEKPFTNELGDIMYPGDSTADPANVWNCRCTMVSQIKGFERNPADLNLRPYHKLGSMTYEEWKEAHKRKKENEQGRAVVNSRDISHTWNRRPDQFDFAIEDIINAQGFDGLPRVVSAEEFDRAVQEANDGNGFIAQRTYSAPNQETLDAYRDQLYNGKWYVDCSNGGASYGMGMYCAADYTGTLSEGIKNEMDGYRDLSASRVSSKDAKSYVETMTLDPSAKIITYREINDIMSGNLSIDYRNDAINDIVYAKGYTKDEATFIRYNLNTGGISWKEVSAAADNLSEEQMDKLMNDVAEIGEKATKAWNEEREKRIATASEYQHKYNNDVGSLAAALGYDAINAEGVGQSGSYTVILNRTKVIIKEP